MKPTSYTIIYSFLIYFLCVQVKCFKAFMSTKSLILSHRAKTVAVEKPFCVLELNKTNSAIV